MPPRKEPEVTQYKPEDEIITNEQGGKQSKIASKITEVPPLALIAVGNVMGNGSVKYPREEDGTPNWHRIDSFSNLDHGLEHAANFSAMRNCTDSLTDQGESMLQELAHHAARAMMALEMFIKESSSEEYIRKVNL